MIEQITIENFKSIGKVTVDLSPVTVLIGRSGVGKSNFLRAIRFLRNYLTSPAKAVEIEGGWTRLWPFGLPVRQSITVRFRLPGFHEPFQYAISWGKTENRADIAQLESERLSMGNAEVFSWGSRQWTAWPGEGPKPTYPPGQVALGSFPTVPEAVLAYTAWTSAIGWYDFPAAVFSGPLTNNERDPQQTGLNDNASNYLSVVLALTQDLRDQHSRRTILARLRQVSPTVRSIELDSVQSPHRVIVGHLFGGEKRALELAQESDGFRRYYAHLLALYQTPPKQVLMFEEPENGVYPGALRNLAEEFIAAADNRRGQILLATQSPELLNGFAAEQLRVVDLDPETQRTVVGPLDADQIESLKTQLLYPGELLTVDQARIAQPTR